MGNIVVGTPPMPNIVTEAPPMPNIVAGGGGRLELPHVTMCGWRLLKGHIVWHMVRNLAELNFTLPHTPQCVAYDKELS